MKKTFILFLVLSTVSISVHAIQISQQWEKAYQMEGFSINLPLSTQQTKDGGYIVSGDLNASAFGLLKLDSNGDISWLKEYDFGGGGEWATSIRQTSDRGYIVAGEAGGILVVLKLDRFGNDSWQKSYGAGGHPSIRQTSDGGYIVAGTTTSSGAGGQDLWILKLESNGNITWQNTYGGSGTEGPTFAQQTYSIEQTSDGGYIVASDTDSFGAGSGDIWVLKLASNGNISWQKTYGGTAGDGIPSIQETTGGGFILAAATYSFAVSQNDILVLKLDNSGSVSWEKTYGESGWELPFSIHEKSDGGYIIAGGVGDFDLCVLNFDSTGVLSQQKIYRERKSSVFPSVSLQDSVKISKRIWLKTD